MACEPDITNEEWTTLYTNISTWVYKPIAPQTIVYSVCDFLDISKTIPVTSTNWCLLTCISSCFFYNTIFYAGTGFEINQPSTLFCITSCYEFEEEDAPATTGSSAGGGGSDAVDDLKKELDNIKVSFAREKDDFDFSLEQTILWYEDIIDRDIIALGIVVASYALWIMHLIEHFGEINIALGIEGIGELIECLVTLLKAITMGAEAANSSIQASIVNTGLGEAAGVVHLHDNVARAAASAIDAASDAVGEAFESVSGAGSCTATGGNIWGHFGDILFDLKRLSFSLGSLAAQILQHILILYHTYKRIEEAIENTKNAFKNLKFYADLEITFKEKEIDFRELFNGEVEPTLRDRYKFPDFTPTLDTRSGTRADGLQLTI